MVSYIQQYFNTFQFSSVWKLLIALFKVPNAGAVTVHNGDSPFWLVLNGTSLNSDSALLALNWRLSNSSTIQPVHWHFCYAYCSLNHTQFHHKIFPSCGGNNRPDVYYRKPTYQESERILVNLILMGVILQYFANYPSWVLLSALYSVQSFH